MQIQIISEKEQLDISLKLLKQAHTDDIEQSAVRLVIQEKNTLLMLRRSAHKGSPGYWELPGGSLESGEDVFSGARRELKEETGRTISKFLSLLDTLEFTTMSRRKKCRQYILSVTTNQDTVVLNPQEHDQFAWFNKTEISKLNTLPETKRFLLRFLKVQPL